MARGINKVILIGNLGSDPEVRYMPSGGAVATLSVATSESWKDKQSGERQERTEWHRVVCFNRLGEIAGEYLRKGSKVYIEGSLRTRKWQDQQGVERYTTEIVGNEMQMLDARGGGAAGFDPMSQAAPMQSHAPQSQTSPSHAPQSHAAQSQAPMQPRSAPPAQQPQSSAPAHDSFADLDDDVPF